MNETAYFVSDLHLMRADDERAKAFLRFLRDLETQASTKASHAPTHLFLVGDVFDLWIGSHDYFVTAFVDIVEAIRALVREGVEVHYFEGNHDLHLHSFWGLSVGAKVHADTATFQIAGSRVRVEHGDLINPDDRGYLFLRAFLRSMPMRTLALHLPSRLVQAIGEKASRASRDYTSTSKTLPQERIREMIRNHARKIADREPFDLLISGHVHVKDDATFKINGREVRSVNLGSWFDGAKTFVLNAEGGGFQEL